MSMEPPIVKVVEEGFTLENEEDPTPRDPENMHRNAQASSAIISALSSNEYARIAEIKSAHKIWKKLETIYEGTDVVKEAIEEELRSKFNHFVMKPNEGPQELYDSLIEIVNKRRSLGAKLTDLEVNKRLFQVL